MGIGKELKARKEVKAQTQIQGVEWKSAHCISPFLLIYLTLYRSQFHRVARLSTEMQLVLVRSIRARMPRELGV
jgi:hypothetical protein